MNKATRDRKREVQDPHAWLWEGLPDPYEDSEKRNDPRHNKTGVSFEYNKSQELKHFAGKVTRVDLVVLPDGTPVKRTWLAGWEPRQKTHEAKRLEDGWTVETAANLLEAQGWVVRRWHNAQGVLEARCFRCGLRCVRTGGARQAWHDRQGPRLAVTGLDDRFDG